MATIGLVIRDDKYGAPQLCDDVAVWAEKHGHQIVTCRTTGREYGQGELAAICGEISESADPIITFGGDGTLIGVARSLEGREPVVMGVNLGRLGFLTEIGPGEVIEALSSIFAGTAKVSRRQMLQVKVERDGRQVFSCQALNEAAVLKGSRDRIFALDVAVDGEAVMRVHADGLIVATPTGSTAYSLSAGGSIAQPWLEVMLLTPICPHSLTVRPLLLEMDSVLNITIPPYEGTVFVTVDGQVSDKLYSGDRVTITRSPTALRILRSKEMSYFDLLRTKLNWGGVKLGDRKQE